MQETWGVSPAFPAPVVHQRVAQWPVLGSMAQLRATSRSLQDAQMLSPAREWAEEGRRLRNDVGSMPLAQVEWQHRFGGEISEFVRR